MKVVEKLVTTVAIRTELRVVDGMAVVNGSLSLVQLLPLKIAAFFSSLPNCKIAKNRAEFNIECICTCRGCKL